MLKKWFREILAVGIKDWFWFVVLLRRNEFHRRLDRDYFNGSAVELIRARQRAHDIDNKLSEIVS
jgi:hypothetical protein